MRAKLTIEGIDLVDAVMWARYHDIPLTFAKSFRTGPTKWIGKVFYYGTRSIIMERIGRGNTSRQTFYVLCRPSDYALLALRFHMREGWRND